jgi:hypothetical protein
MNHSYTEAPLVVEENGNDIAASVTSTTPLLHELL